jgi:hypothetical protein
VRNEGCCRHVDYNNLMPVFCTWSRIMHSYTLNTPPLPGFYTSRLSSFPDNSRPIWGEFGFILMENVASFTVLACYKVRYKIFTAVTKTLKHSFKQSCLELAITPWLIDVTLNVLFSKHDWFNQLLTESECMKIPYHRRNYNEISTTSFVSVLGQGTCSVTRCDMNVNIG